MYKEAFFLLLLAVCSYVVDFFLPGFGFHYIAILSCLFSGVLIIYSTLAMLFFIWSFEWFFLLERIKMIKKKKWILVK